jgi:uncharacterized protein YndB with AHSA1/START domain
LRKKENIMIMERFEYVTYIATTPERLWKALVDPKFTKKYWQHENLSDWKPGSRWEHRSSKSDASLDLVGNVIENKPGRRLVLSWAAPDEAAHEEKNSKVTIELEPFQGVVRLTVTHEHLEPNSEMLKGIREGWPKVLSSLKSLMERDRPLPELW